MSACIKELNFRLHYVLHETNFALGCLVNYKRNFKVKKNLQEQDLGLEYCFLIKVKKKKNLEEEKTLGARRKIMWGEFE